jgi:hypothetical protein
MADTNVSATITPAEVAPKFGQVVKLGSLLRKTDLDDEQTETVSG